MLDQDRLISSNRFLEHPNIILCGVDPWAALITPRRLRLSGFERLKLCSEPREDDFLKISNVCGPVAQTSTPNQDYRLKTDERYSLTAGVAQLARLTQRRGMEKGPRWAMRAGAQSGASGPGALRYGPRSRS